MSVIKLTIIGCDCCGETYADGDAKVDTATSQRKEYKADGWVNRGQFDYCSECKKGVNQ